MAGDLDQLRATLASLRPVRLFTWQCLGKSEAELGEITERALEGMGFQTGYRAHRPYIEVKVWVPERELADPEGARRWEAARASLEEAIAPWVATRQGEDLADALASEIERLGGESGDIEIFDCLSGGILAERLGSAWRDPRHAAIAARTDLMVEWAGASDPRDRVESVLQQSSDAGLTLAAAGFGAEGEYCLGLRLEEHARVVDLRSPFFSEMKTPDFRDRIYRLAAEITLKQWRDWLRERARFSS